MTADTRTFRELTALLRRLPFPWFRLRAPRLRIARCYDRYLQRQALADLDDYLRRDIGITPEELRRECRKLF